MARRRAIGLVTSFISGRFFEQVLRGIQQIARQHLVDVVVVHGTPEHVALTQVGQQHVDGWLVLTYTVGVELLAEQGKPIVTISGRRPDLALAAVLPDNRGGVERAMEHLIELGHTCIAFVGDTEIGDIHERYVAYQSMLKRHSLQFDPECVVITDSPLADRGVAAADRLLASRRTWTAVVAGNDWTAIGLMRGLQTRGYRIPEDIAVVGFDDIPEAQMTNPPLSTVHQHSEELGATAARLLLAQITGQLSIPETLYVPTTFVSRTSSWGNPTRRPIQWRGQAAANDSLWVSRLADELARVLLPALPFHPPPAPAQVWPEVDRLVRLLARTVDGTAPPIDSRVIQAIFAAPPLLNANAEILAEMLRVLEIAGRLRGADQPDSEPANVRLADLLDQLLIEAMRSYRRRQSRSQRTLREVLQSQYDISQYLLQHAPQQLDWLKETHLDFGCLGLWMPDHGGDEPLLSIAGCYQRIGSGALRPGSSYAAAQFPPLERLSTEAPQSDITTWLILTVRAADHDWGLLAVAGRLISDDPWLEDATVNVLEICCSLLGIMLEREALQESLRYAAAAEQAQLDRVRDRVCPAIAVADGVVLILLVGPLDEATPHIVLEALHATGSWAALVLLDVGRLSSGTSGAGLAAIIRLIVRLGSDVTLLGASTLLVNDLHERGLAVNAHPDLATALSNLITATPKPA
ncbi:MAG: substrate-binding domain-containing protein [Herpetosiphonaceae bacterium]|nr:substrate-binding domain-containing protein [Herpetosiphonaceae bacterium]